MAVTRAVGHAVMEPDHDLPFIVLSRLSIPLLPGFYLAFSEPDCLGFLRLRSRFGRSRRNVDFFDYQYTTF